MLWLINAAQEQGVHRWSLPLRKSHLTLKRKSQILIPLHASDAQLLLLSSSRDS